MSSLAVRRFGNSELNHHIDQIEKEVFKSAVVIGYKKLEEQRGKCRARALAISSAIFSGWCIFSSVLSAYSTGKAYDEFVGEGGFSNGGGSIGGHTAEWWPRIFGSIFTSVSWIYLLHNKGKFHNMARLCKEKILQIEQTSPDERETILGIVDYSVVETERYRGNIPFFGDDKFILLPQQDDPAVDLELGESSAAGNEV